MVHNEDIIPNYKFLKLITDAHNEVTSVDKVVRLLNTRPLLTKNRTTVRQQAKAKAVEREVARATATTKATTAADAKRKRTQHQMWSVGRQLWMTVDMPT
jgi:hypothetical protein